MRITREGHDASVFVQVHNVGDRVAMGFPTPIVLHLSNQPFVSEYLVLHHGASTTGLTENVGFYRIK